MTKKILIPALVLGLSSATVLATSHVQAFGGWGQNGTFAQELAGKLGKSETEVTTALDQIRSEHQAEQTAQLESRLTEAVNDGSLTDAQKQLILEKHAQLQAEHQDEMDQFQSMTPEERRAERQSERQDLEAWAAANNIDLSLFFGSMNGMGGGRHGMGGAGYGRNL